MGFHPLPPRSRAFTRARVGEVGNARARWGLWDLWCKIPVPRFIKGMPRLMAPLPALDGS